MPPLTEGVVPYGQREHLFVADYPTLRATCELLDRIGTNLYEDALMPIALAHQYVAYPLQMATNVLKLFSEQHLAVGASSRRCRCSEAVRLRRPRERDANRRRSGVTLVCAERRASSLEDSYGPRAQRRVMASRSGRRGGSATRWRNVALDLVRQFRLITVSAA